MEPCDDVNGKDCKLEEYLFPDPDTPFANDSLVAY